VVEAHERLIREAARAFNERDDALKAAGLTDQ